VWKSTKSGTYRQPPGMNAPHLMIVSASLPAILDVAFALGDDTAAFFQAETATLFLKTFKSARVRFSSSSKDCTVLCNLTRTIVICNDCPSPDKIPSVRLRKI
jgi:hypothetical protein